MESLVALGMVLFFLSAAVLVFYLNRARKAAALAKSKAFSMPLSALEQFASLYDNQTFSDWSEVLQFERKIRQEFIRLTERSILQGLDLAEATELMGKICWRLSSVLPERRQILQDESFAFWACAHRLYERFYHGPNSFFLAQHAYELSTIMIEFGKEFEAEEFCIKARPWIEELRKLHWYNNIFDSLRAYLLYAQSEIAKANYAQARAAMNTAKYIVMAGDDRSYGRFPEYVFWRGRLQTMQRRFDEMASG